MIKSVLLRKDDPEKVFKDSIHLEKSLLPRVLITAL